MMGPDGPRPEDQRSLVPIVGSFLVGGAFLLIVGFWVGGRDRSPDASRIDPPRQITVVEPDSGAVVGTEVGIVFETSMPLHFMRDSWMVGRAHLHASIDGVELMPNRDEVDEIGERRYRLNLVGLASGAREIRLFWSGPDHRPLPDGGSRTIPLEVRSPPGGDSLDGGPEFD